MAGLSFVRGAFKLVWQRSSLVAAEIAWRWAFAVVGWSLAGFVLWQILQGADFSPPELAASSRNQFFFAAAIAARVLPLVARAMLVVVPALLLLWLVIASL